MTDVITGLCENDTVSILENLLPKRAFKSNHRIAQKDKFQTFIEKSVTIIVHTFSIQGVSVKDALNLRFCR